jgi:hypothetical protein
MRKGILGVFALVGVLLFSNYSRAGGLLGELKDDIDEQCVINCLQDDGQSTGECKRADVIACREVCHLPPPARLIIGGTVVNPDLEDPGKIKGIFESALRAIGLTDKEVTTSISFNTNNPLAELGIDVSMTGFLTLLPPNFVFPEIGGVGNTVVYSGEIPCMASKTFTYPSGNKGLGCREVKKNGAAGWAAQGCGLETSAASDAWYGNWSGFCCNAVGRACPTCPLVAGEGVCSVNSTAGGDGVY